MNDTPLNDDVRREIEALLAEGRKIEAIKRYRESTGADLNQAKHAIEIMAIELQGATEPAAEPIKPSGCVFVMALSIAAIATLAFAF